jgi:hypothetical protein
MGLRYPKQDKPTNSKRFEVFVEAKAQAAIACRSLSAFGENERGTTFRIDLQEVRLSIDADGRPRDANSSSKIEEIKSALRRRMLRLIST